MADKLFLRMFRTAPIVSTALWVALSGQQLVIGSDQLSVGEFELQEIGQCSAAFEANRAKVGTAMAATEGRLTSVHRLDASKSYVNRERTVIGWFVDRTGDNVSVTRRSDVSGDRRSPIGPVDSDYWVSLIVFGNKRFSYFDEMWTEVRRENGKDSIPFVDWSFDPFCIAAAPESSLAARCIDDNYFAKCTSLNQLSEVKVTESDVFARWIGSKKLHSFVVRFDRRSRMPIECELSFGREVVGDNGAKRKVWDLSLGRTRASWSKKKNGVWTVDRVNLSGTQDPMLRREWEIEFRWAFGDDVDRKWFDVQTAPRGDVVFNAIWNSEM